ncbi:MAG TPA: DUF2255 family protein [Conexibacter sp.]
MTQQQAVDYVDHTDVIQIATERPRGGEAVTPIWGVVIDGVPYIRSGYGTRSRWYSGAQRAGRVALVDGGTRYPAAIENIDDDATIHEVDRAYETKYAGSGESLRRMVRPDASRLTMRLKPL